METNINFKPWVGKNYLSKGFRGKRILVLGESHYCISPLKEGGKCFPLCKKKNMNTACFDFTNDVMNDILYGYNGEPYMRTFTCFERSVLGKELNQKEREEFWESVIFYNYIQYALSGPGLAPQDDYWHKSELAFKELLEEYMPDNIIVWGARLYNRLPDWNGEGTFLEIDENKKTNVWTYTIKGKKIPALKVLHPCSSRGKNWTFWHEFYKLFLDM